MLVLDHGGQHLIEGGVDRYRDDVVARHHDFAYGDVIEIEDAMDDVLLHFGEVSEPAAGTDDEFQLLGGVAAAALPVAYTQHVGDGGAGFFDYPYKRPGNAVENQQHGSHERRQPVGAIG